MFVAYQQLPTQLYKNNGCSTSYVNGIIYTQYSGVVNYDKIMSCQKNVSEIIEKYKLDLVPLVVIVDKVEKIDIKISEYSKILAGYNVFIHISGIWVVGGSFLVRLAAKTFSHTFFNDKIKLSESKEEAEKQIQESGKDFSIFDK